MNKSIFAYPHIYNGKHYVVLTLKRRIFEVEKDVYSALTNGAIDDLSHHNDFKKMCDLGILVEDGIDEVQCLEDAFLRSDDDAAWNSLHIIPTTNCNMQCNYCFIMKDMETSFHHRNLSPETLHKAIDLFIAGNTSKKKAMTFYGGEPFVNKQIVFDAVRYSKAKYPGEFEYKIVTNGTLVTYEIAAFLAENGFDVNVSLDGDRPAHDANRTYRGNKTTYDDTILGIKRLINAGNSVKILMTVGSHNIESLDKCTETLLSLGPTSIALNLPKKLQHSDNEIEDGLSNEIIKRKYLECLEMCYKAHIPEAHFADIVYGFLSTDMHYRPCAGCGKQIAVSPFNKVGPCQAYISTGKYFVDFDNITSSDQLRDTDEFKLWKGITMYGCEKCRNCYLLPVCPGDCPFDWENRMGSFSTPPDSYCFSRKMMFDELIERYISGRPVLFRGKSK